MKRAVGCVGGEINEERTVSFLALLHEFQGVIEVNIRAIAFHFHWLSIVKQGGVGVFPFGSDWIRGLSDASSTKHQSFFKPLIHGPQGIVVSHMPFAENARCIPGFKKSFRQGFLLRIHHGTSNVGIDAARAIIITTGHQAGPGRCTYRADIVLGHLGTCGFHGIQVGRAEDRIAIEPKIAVTLVIGNDDDNIWARTFLCSLQVKR